MTQSKDFWNAKLRALLLPTPFAEIDPDGEPARRDELEKLLPAVDTIKPDELNPLLELCAKEAYDANVVLPIPKERPRQPVKRRHPLSGEELGWSLDPERVRELYQVLLGIAEKCVKEDDPQKRYQSVWYQQMRLSSADTPWSEIPGSLMLPDHSVFAHRSLRAALLGARLWKKDDSPVLLYMHFGPVQDFIKAARRTHDLWIGSFTLVYLTYRGIEAIAKELGPDALVYPDLSQLPLAQARLFGDSKDNEHLIRSSIANKLLAIVPSSAAESLANKAAKAVDAAWQGMGNSVEKLLKDVDKKAWSDQIKQHLEMDAVIQPWPKTRTELETLLVNAGLPQNLISDLPEDSVGAGFGGLYDLTHRVLASHRMTVFPANRQGDHRPKCVQCGIREQMGPISDPPSLQQKRSREFFDTLSKEIQSKGTPASLQLPKGNHLCAVCFTKRFARSEFFGAEAAELGLDWKNPKHRHLLRFPSTYSIGSAPFRFQTLTKAPEKTVLRWVTEIEKLSERDCLNFEAPGCLLPGLEKAKSALSSEIQKRFLSQEGNWLYERPYEPVCAWRDFTGQDPPKQKQDSRYENLLENLPEAKRCYAALKEAVGASPSRYFAVLVMDGDHMGDWTTGKHPATPKVGLLSNGTCDKDWENRPRPLFPALQAELSRRLGKLAQAQHETVEKYLGRVVYSGGDDLLALLPLQTALPCMDAIIEQARQPEFLGANVTWSAGLAIGQVLDPLGGLLSMAQQAEKKSKDCNRDRFTVWLPKGYGETEGKGEASVFLTLPWRWPSPTEGAADRPQFSTIESILNLVSFNPNGEADGPSAEAQEESRPLGSFRVAYQLYHELRQLRLPDNPKNVEQELVDMTLSRAETLLGLNKKKDKKDDAQRLRSFWEWVARPENGVPTLVNLLLLARFLVREEGGIDTRELIDCLRGGAR